MRTWIPAAWAVVLSGLFGGGAAAQAPVGPRPPTFSPYLNLLRQGNSPAVNYYGLVRPEMDARNSFRALQGQIIDNRQAISNQATAASSALPGTGDKSVFFLNTGGYFLNLNPQGGVGAGGVGGGGFGTLGNAGAGGRGGVGNQASGQRGGGGRPSPPR